MNIIIADDHATFRDSLEFFLSHKTSHEIVTSVDTLQALKEEIPNHKVDLVLIDYHMPEGDALVVADYIMRKFKPIKLAFLTGTQSSLTLKQIVESSANGALHKEEGVNQIVEALEAIEQGERYISTSILEKIACNDFELTAREYHTLSLIVQGYNSSQIGEFMHISARTVDKHKENLMQKMKVSNVVQLVAMAHKLQLFAPGNEEKS